MKFVIVRYNLMIMVLLMLSIYPMYCTNLMETLRPRFGDHLERIVNGVNAREESTRHQISLRRYRSDRLLFGAGHICGGALIRPNIVLTAAHCFVDQVKYDGTFLPITDFIVVIGTLNRFKANPYTLSLELRNRILPLNKFVLSTYDMDIALLLLNDSVGIDHPFAGTIELTEKLLEPHTMCQVTGWGRTESGYNSAILMSMDIPLITNNECKMKNEIAKNLLLPGMICAGYLGLGHSDACSGDSGGPLVCHGKLVGIVSWGMSCGGSILPGIYTNVVYYKEWININIERFIKEENLSRTVNYMEMLDSNINSLLTSSGCGDHAKLHHFVVYFWAVYKNKKLVFSLILLSNFLIIRNGLQYVA